MVNVQREYPAHRPDPSETIAERGEFAYRADRLPIPFAFSSMSRGARHPAASSQSAVYFAVNPSLDMFRGFARGCLTRGREWRTQLSALSSYASIRIWRVDAYAFCPHGVGTGTPECLLPPTVPSVEVPNAFTAETGWDTYDIRNCERAFAVAVESIEYINAENMAVTVLEAPFKEYDADTGLLVPNATRSSRRVYFMSTETMALGDVPWARDHTANAGAGQGTLCPAQRRLPNVGSLAAEVAVTGVNLARPVVGLLVGLPGMIHIWSQGRACSAVTHGHSLLRRCGGDLLSLDDAFDSLQRANTHFWASFGLVASRVRELGQQEVANVVDGVAHYGRGRITAVAGPASFLVTSFQLPTGPASRAVMNALMPPGGRIFSSASFVTSSPLRLSAMSVNLVLGAVSDAIPLAIRLGRDGRDRPAAR